MNIRFCLAALLLSFATAQEAKKEPVQIVSLTQKVTEIEVNGKKEEKLINVADKGVDPGSLLQLTQNVLNTLPQSVKNLKLNMAIPKETVFKDQSCSFEDYTALYSIDGQKFSKEPLMKKVKVKENGKEIEKEVKVQPSEYTHVRWEIASLPSNKKHQCYIRAAVK